MDMTTQNKDRIYDYLSKNKLSFIYKKDVNDKIKSMNYLLSKICNLSFSSLEECFEFLTTHWDKKCKNTGCNNLRKLTSLFPNRESYIKVNKTYGIYKFCDNSECNYTSISNRQSGEGNTCHRMTEETFKSMCIKNSFKMKQNIKEGRFIPNITNSWSKSRCCIEFVRNNELVKMKTRSTWDAYFQLFNPNILYEKLIITYKLNKIEYNYIVDFIDIENKIIYEIKPVSNINNSKNKAKIRYARKWAKSNNYKFIIIKDSWFKKHYNEELINGQPSEEKMKRNLKQFK